MKFFEDIVLPETININYKPPPFIVKRKLVQSLFELRAYSGFVQSGKVREKIKLLGSVRESHGKSGKFFLVWKKLGCRAKVREKVFEKN